jgi:hypothetical protein
MMHKCRVFLTVVEKNSFVFKFIYLKILMFVSKNIVDTNLNARRRIRHIRAYEALAPSSLCLK